MQDKVKTKKTIYEWSIEITTNILINNANYITKKDRNKF